MRALVRNTSKKIISDGGRTFDLKSFTADLCLLLKASVALPFLANSVSLIVCEID
jgi:hypothetical protein